MSGLADPSDAWAAAAWRASWQGGLAALVVWSVCRLVPSMPARFRSWLWRLVVVKFAVALLWSAPRRGAAPAGPGTGDGGTHPPVRPGAARVGK